MTGPRFDAIIHAANRLQICAMLSAVDDADFSAVRDDLDLSDSVLSKHLKILVDVGYVVVLPYSRGGRARKKIALTPAGRRAFDAHIVELRRLIG